MTKSERAKAAWARAQARLIAAEARAVAAEKRAAAAWAAWVQAQKAARGVKP